MERCLDFAKVEPEGNRIMVSLERFVKASGLEPSLIELVKLRASQFKGCAYWIDMHTKGAHLLGETEQRRFALSAWRETPFYSERERGALAWSEVLTLIGENHVPDDLYQDVRQQFSEKELVDLTHAVIVINSWNRLAISFRSVPGTYRPLMLSQEV